MGSDKCYEVATPEVVDEDFGTEIVVLNLADGRYFSLRGVAAALWRDARAGHAPGCLADAAGAGDETLGAAVADFFSSLFEAGLLRECERPGVRPTGEAASLAELLRERQAPLLEVFDDMAELILSDPIHDVEEDIGWPVRRDAP